MRHGLDRSLWGSAKLSVVVASSPSLCARSVTSSPPTLCRGRPVRMISRTYYLPSALTSDLADVVSSLQSPVSSLPPNLQTRPARVPLAMYMT